MYKLDLPSFSRETPDDLDSLTDRCGHEIKDCAIFVHNFRILQG